jgi:hypothetical protein
VAEPCEVWPVNEACSYGIPADPGARSPLETFAMEIATSQLWRLTAGVYGLCPITVRPCGNACRGFVYFPTQTAQGIWINVTCGCEQSNCDCCYVCEIRLEGPVASVTEVKIDGIVIDPDTYRIDNGNQLVRVEGECWPKCQTLALPDTEDGTFSVTYEKGLPVPFGGQRAVAALAAEIIKACEAGPCRLPSGVREIFRQGERIEFVNGIDLLRAGLTNIPEVDSWVLSVNPRSQREVSSVWSPDDVPQLRTTTWP